jgi:hypothetical protein
MSTPQGVAPLAEIFRIMRDDYQRQHRPFHLSWIDYIQACQARGLVHPDGDYSFERREDGDYLIAGAYIVSPPTPLDRWIAECTTPSTGWISTTALFASWTKWAEQHNEIAGSINPFSTALRKKGWWKMRSRDQKSNGFAGKGLK